MYLIYCEGAEMTGVSRRTEYPLLHNIPYSQPNLIASPAQTPSVWLLLPVLIVAKDRGMHGKHWRQKTNLFWVGGAREL